jgi:hypothetical protein
LCRSQKRIIGPNPAKRIQQILPDLLDPGLGVSRLAARLLEDTLCRTFQGEPSFLYQILDPKEGLHVCRRVDPAAGPVLCRRENPDLLFPIP